MGKYSNYPRIRWGSQELMAYIYRDGKRIDFDDTPLIRPPDLIYVRRHMPDAPTQKYRLTIQYPPSPTKTGGAFIKDEDGVLNFGDSSLLNLQQKDVIDVERTYNAPKGKFNASFTINSWKPAAPAEQQPPKPFLRPRTDPKDQRQMWVTALMKEWIAAYAQSCSITTTGEMKPMNAAVVEQAARVCGTVYDRLFGPMTQSGADLQTPPNPREDMDDEIPEFAPR